MTEFEFERYVENLKEALFSLPYANWTSNNTVVSIRCPFCGDSVKHINTTHFGVHIPKNSEDMPWYHCFLCGTSGVVKGDDLIDWGIHDGELIKATKGIYRDNLLLGKNIKKFGLIKHDLKVKPSRFQRDPNTRAKLRYINQRLGTRIDFNMAARLKIVLNIEEILPVDDKGNYLTQPHKIMNVLSEYYVGFLSYDNGYLTCRKIIEEDRKDNFKLKRYMIYNIFDKIDSSRKFYVIPTTVDIFKPVTINIAEGPFDILGIYFNVFETEEDRKNNIFIAVNGSDYKSVIQSFMKLGFIDAEYVIWSDNEPAKDLKYYRNLKKSIGEERFMKPLKIVYNVKNEDKLAKVDFGVRKEDIEISHTYL